jgi:hypothetical protein
VAAMAARVRTGGQASHSSAGNFACRGKTVLIRRGYRLRPRGSACEERACPVGARSCRGLGEPGKTLDAMVDVKALQQLQKGQASPGWMTVPTAAITRSRTRTSQDSAGALASQMPSI